MLVTMVHAQVVCDTHHDTCHAAVDSHNLVFTDTNTNGGQELVVQDAATQTNNISNIISTNHYAEQFSQPWIHIKVSTF